MKSYAYLAYNYFILEKYDNAKDYVLKAQTFLNKLSKVDEIIVEHINKKLTETLFYTNLGSLGTSAVVDFVEERLPKDILDTKQISKIISHQNQIPADDSCPNNHFINNIFTEKCDVLWEPI